MKKSRHLYLLPQILQTQGLAYFRRVIREMLRGRIISKALNSTIFRKAICSFAIATYSFSFSIGTGIAATNLQAAPSIGIIYQLQLAFYPAGIISALFRNVSSDTAAAREAVRQLMEGNKRKADSDAGWQLIRSIFTHWAAETDLGATIKLEFVGLDLPGSEKLKSGLEQQTAIGAVWVRSIDASAISVIE